MIDRHVAPAQHRLALGLDDALDHGLAGVAGGLALGQEHHADAVVAGLRQLDAELARHRTEEAVRDLDQDTGTVAGERVRPDRAAVVEIHQDLETLADQVVALVTLDVRDEADAARVVLVRGVVEPLLFRLHTHPTFPLPRPVPCRHPRIRPKPGAAAVCRAPQCLVARRQDPGRPTLGSPLDPPGRVARHPGRAAFARLRGKLPATIA